ncbi:MAG TPA: hypothetical protein PKB10_14080, partial [Tepidisphaeraceae bacterium]|nr:hypothetical protein [Tepidisphaeraceae bacterium]
MAITEEEIYQALVSGNIRLPPLVIRLTEWQPRIPALSASAYRPDAVVEVSQDRRRWKFLVELKAVSTPKMFDSAIAAVQPAAQKAKLSPMVVMPYLSPDNLARLESAGISGLDLCGNGIVMVGDELLVMRTGQPNRYPRSEPIRNVYRG